MGTQVITRDSGRRLGVVGEVIVDVDRREVVALGLRDNPLTRFLPGLPRWMRLDEIRQVGDVVLVDSTDSLAENFDADRYTRVINCQVITESGQQLGRVLGFSFDIETGELLNLVIGALGVPLLGDGVLSTWELPVEEIVSSGADRIIVYEGAEDKLKQLTTGVLEKLGVGGGAWDREERQRLGGAMVPVENQLATGAPSEMGQQRLSPAQGARYSQQERRYDEREMEYVEVERPDGASEEQQQQRRLYLDDEEPDRRPPTVPPGSGGNAYWDPEDDNDGLPQRQPRRPDTSFNTRDGRRQGSLDAPVDVEAEPIEREDPWGESRYSRGSSSR
ncbi:MAG: photosystem reaction center subunit H [Aphanocapsa feldmannii 277cV]|uniref:Photosystem reaction center subunit H n=2 Tax=Aphanocapsa feldmannii TaxID=192050 RepID=A0A524RRM8_9CHRO|nr:MAG: photosystem reaction center subunit H [Aphanocapsa feldmannii 277cV]TGH20803.1 MAG: photosystem reaction center subunit H [Aphanocapsa feldmannii 277cI]